MAQVRNRKDVFLSAHLTEADMYCKSAMPPVSHFIDDTLVDVVEIVRAEFGPLLITSTFRTEQSNALAGGATKSQHKLGKACDHRPADPEQWELYKAMIATRTGIYEKLVAAGARGFGSYDNFVHVDVRDKAEPVHWSDMSMSVQQIIEKALDPEKEDRKDMVLDHVKGKVKQHPLLVAGVLLVILLWWCSGDD